jgi:signal transduction histidine kinase
MTALARPPTVSPVDVPTREELHLHPRPVGGRRRQLALVLVVGAIEVGGTFLAARRQPERADLDLLAVGLILAGAAALALRGRYPVGVLVFVHAATLSYWLLDYPGGPIFLAPIIAFFRVVLVGRRLAAWTLLAVGFAAFSFLPWLTGREDAPDLAQLLGLGAWLLVLGTVAEFARARRERAAEAHRMLREEARRRASEERLAIARELHDVLAHNISMINVQAGVALHLLDERPEQARPALTAIKQASKEALVELRSVLGVLRRVDDEQDGSRDPAPTLGRVDDLVARTDATGLSVRLEREGEPLPLPTPVDVAAFRIVQEALTNVVRHAAATTAVVRIAYRPEGLTVEVDDDGRTAATAGPGGGSGIVGMRERAESVGGSLEAGPRPGGGFRVRARLPLREDRS